MRAPLPWLGQPRSQYALSPKESGTIAPEEDLTRFSQKRCSLILRRLVKKFITLRTLLPVRYDLVKAQICRTFLLAISTRPRKLATIWLWLVLPAVFASQQHYLLAVGFSLPIFLILAVRVHERVAEWKQVRRIVSGIREWEGMPPAREILLAIGLELEVVDRILSEADARPEVTIAEFDQNNRVISRVGHIPLFDGYLIGPKEFRPRARNRVLLVVLSGVVAIKKIYGEYGRFCNEALALYALSEVDGIPKIISARARERVLYQSFIPGSNLGSLIDKCGASVSIQYEASVQYPGRGKSTEGQRFPSARQLALEALNKAVDKDLVTAIGRLVERIHNAGVAIRDVKYGNVIVHRGRPCLCDFDGARIFQKNNWRCLMERESDRDKFNYYFGTELISEQSFLRQLRYLVERKQDILYAPVYYGRGYKAGKIASVEFGTGKWLFIRRYLPDVRGKTIIDLGSHNCLLPLEMLRRGAARVVAFEVNSVAAQFARLNHGWYEFVDNRKYNLELIEGDMNEVCKLELSEYDGATAFCSLYYASEENMEKIVRALSGSVEFFVVQCNQNPNEHIGELLRRCSLAFIRDLLRRNGFGRLEIVSFWYYDRPLIIAWPS